MKAWVLDRTGGWDLPDGPLSLREVPTPEPGLGQVRIRVWACGVCHTELDEIDGRAAPPHPVIPGHQIVGEVDTIGSAVERSWLGRRVGVAWIASACGRCPRCLEGRENLCPEFRATGLDVDGGYAEYCVADVRFVYPLPQGFEPVRAAPLLCAGAIGYRSLRLAEMRDGLTLGLMGFGASAHLVLQLARRMYPSSRVVVFARSESERDFAIQLGAHWAGDIHEVPPQAPDRIIDTTPVWSTVLASLRALAPGGRLVINAIRKESSDQDAWLKLDYARDLWMEKQLSTVANVTRADVREFLGLAAEFHLQPEIQTFAFHEANQALRELYARRIRGAKVLLAPG